MENIGTYTHLYKVALDLIYMGGRFIDFMGYSSCQVVGQDIARKIWKEAFKSIEGGN